MVRLLAALLLLVPVCAPTISAQEEPPAPIFSPPTARPAEKAADAPKPAVKQDSVDRVFARLRRWPSRRAREASILLAGLGPKVKDRLIKGLADNDWRIRAGCANALAEMGERDAIEALIAAIQDPSNRAGIGDLFLALGRIDPKRGTGVMLPFVTHSSSRIRRDVMRALPPTIDPQFLPQVLAVLRHDSGKVRRRGLELMARIPGAEERQEFFRALADPESGVASFAARHLGERSTPGVREHLKEIARTGPLRQATHAFLALVYDEDASGTAIIPDKGPLRERAQKMFAVKDPFYQGAAAVVLSNVGYRSADPGLRQIADKYLVPTLLGAVAGGIFYSDYSTLETLCFKKLELISGMRYGQNALRWKSWWRGVFEKFRARRELRALSSQDLARCEVHFSRQAMDGRMKVVILSGDAERLGSAEGDTPLVLAARDLAELAQLMDSTRFFAQRGEARAGLPDGGYTQIEVRVGNSQYRRFHQGLGPVDLQPLTSFLEAMERRLSWQRFLVGREGQDLDTFRREQLKFFAQTTDEAARKARLLELAIATYPRLSRKGRRLAVEVFRREGDPKWVAANATNLAALLRLDARLTDEAAQIIDLISAEPDPQLRETVLAAVADASPARSGRVLKSYMGHQPLPVVVRLMNDERPRVRAAAAIALQRFRDKGEVVDLLIEGLKDYELEVREACIESLAAMKDERVMAMLNTVFAGKDERLKVRAVRALARVGGTQSVPRLMEIYRESKGAQMWACVRALKDAGGRRAVVALSGIVRESTGDLEVRKEALEVLRRMGGADVALRLKEILERVPDQGLRALAIDALAQVSGQAAIVDLLPLLADADGGVARAAALSLGRLGAPQARGYLLKLMESLEGDQAAERALEDLTFFAAKGRSPAERHRQHAAWGDRYAGLTRREWFLLAARQVGVEFDDSLDWLAPEQLRSAQVNTLLTLMDKGNRPQRAHAERVMLKLSGLMLQPLGPVASRADVLTRIGVYRSWARRELK